MKRVRVVLDTNVLISATQWPDSVAQKVLQRIYNEKAEVFTSAEILEEYTEVLIRDFDYQEEQLGAIMSRVLALVQIVEIKSSVQIVLEDPDDDKVINCALDCNAEAILTYDRHLLKLGQFEKIRIVPPEAFMQEG